MFALQPKLKATLGVPVSLRTMQGNRRAQTRIPASQPSSPAKAGLGEPSGRCDINRCGAMGPGSRPAFETFFNCDPSFEKGTYAVHILRLWQRKQGRFSARSRVCECPRAQQVAWACLVAISVVICPFAAPLSSMPAVSQFIVAHCQIIGNT